MMFARRKAIAASAPSLAEAATGASYEALRFLTQQELEHNPTNFALAWQLKANRRGMTAMAVDAILMEGRSLTQADVDRIMIAQTRRDKDAADAADPRQDALRHQTLRLADLAAGAAEPGDDDIARRFRYRLCKPVPVA